MKTGEEKRAGIIVSFLQPGETPIYSVSNTCCLQNCQAFSHHVFPGCRSSSSGHQNDHSWQMWAFPTIPLHTLKEQWQQSCVCDTAVAQQWIGWLSPSSMVPATRQQSRARAQLTAEDAERCSLSWLYQLTGGSLLVRIPARNWARGRPGCCPPVNHSCSSHSSQLIGRTVCQLYEDFSLWGNLIDF